MPHHVGSTDAYLFRNAYRAALSDMEFKKNRLDNPRQRTKTDRDFFEKPAWCAGYRLGVMTFSIRMIRAAELTVLYHEWTNIRDNTPGAAFVEDFSTVR